MRPPGYSFAAAVLALAGACGDEIELPPVVWEGEHLRFATDADDSMICAGTLPYLDGIVGHLGEVFGRPDVRVDYHWAPDGTAPYCRDAGEGCTNEHGAFSRHVIHQHELVHAVRYPSLLYRPIEEGLAEAYGDDWARFSVEGEILGLLGQESGPFPDSGYGLAGHFVSYLEASNGIEPLVELDAATGFDGSLSQFESAFERIYDQPLDDAISDYEVDYPRCDTPNFRDKEFDCSRNVVAAPTQIDAMASTIVPMSCDDPSVLGPRLGQRWNTLTLDVRVAGRYHIATRPTGNDGLEFIRITRCDISCFEYPDDLLSRTTGTELGSSFCLEPAQYLFRFAIDDSMTDDYQFAVTRTDYPPCD